MSEKLAYKRLLNQLFLFGNLDYFRSQIYLINHPKPSSWYDDLLSSHSQLFSLHQYTASATITAYKRPGIEESA